MEYRFELGGVPVALKYTVNAMCAIEDNAPGSVADLPEKEYTAARLLLWGGMLHAQPDLTLSEAGDMIDGHIARGGSLEEVAERCLEGLRRCGFVS